MKPGLWEDVVASGVCYVDIAATAASGKGTVFLVMPGHEVAGIITELGAGGTRWRADQFAGSAISY